MRFESIRRQVASRADAVRLACEWEVCAPKLGNVHHRARFADCDHSDFLRAAGAIAPVLGSDDRALTLGDRILLAVKATREVTLSNVNLGIILLIAPLAMADDPGAVRRGIESLTLDDGQKVFAAIRLASPGGMKREDVAPEQDVQAESARPVDLLAAMKQAASRDRIALQYATAFSDFFTRVVPLVKAELDQPHDVESSIVNAQIRLMAEDVDSLIARKCGDEIAQEARRRAIDCWHDNSAAARERLDTWLRADGNRRNPGTTADLIAASLYWLLRPASTEVAHHG